MFVEHTNPHRWKAATNATVGIAIGSAGTDAAIETADIVFVFHERSRLCWVLRHSVACPTLVQLVAARLPELSAGPRPFGG